MFWRKKKSCAITGRGLVAASPPIHGGDSMRAWCVRMLESEWAGLQNSAAARRPIPGDLVAGLKRAADISLKQGLSAR
jgi:hypothetical protein